MAERKRSALLLKLAQNNKRTNNPILRKRARSLSTSVRPSTSEEFQILSEEQDMEHAWPMSSAVSPSSNLESQIVSVKKNRDVDSSGSSETPQNNIFNKRKCDIKQLKISGINITSSTGPVRSWLCEKEVANPKVIVIDNIAQENDPVNNQPRGVRTRGGSKRGLSIGKNLKRRIENDNTNGSSFCKIPSTSRSSNVKDDVSEDRSEQIENTLTLIVDSTLSKVKDKEKGTKLTRPKITDTLIENDNDSGLSFCQIPSTSQSCFVEDLISKEKSEHIENALTSIVGSTLHDTGDKKKGEKLSRPKNTDVPLTDEQLLNILEDSDDDFNEDIFDDEFLQNFRDDINEENDGSNTSEDESVPANEQDHSGPKWTNNNNSNRNRFNFIGHPVGLKIQPEGSKPIDYFNLIVTDECLEIIIKASNRNAVRLLEQSLPGSRIKNWKDITIDEFKIFLGLLFHMGTIKINKLQDYWKKHRLFNLTCFSNYMSRNRFLLILRALHFENVDESDNNRLSKISSLVTYFNERMKEIYFPSNSLCIDESLVLWRGRLIFRQYIQNKCHKYGIKLYIMTDVNGVILKIIVYAGAGDTVVGGTNHAEKVVTQLLQDYVEKGFSVYMDNFYNSVNLADKLLKLKTYCTGTLRSNRKNNPKEVIEKKLKKGEFVAQYNKEGICVMKWRDNRDVLLISSEYDSTMTNTTTRRNTEVTKPLMVINYNKNMGGIDHQDQMLSYYSCEHKTIRWYKKLGIHLLQQMMYNAFTLHNVMLEKKMPFSDFRLAVIEHLVPDTPNDHNNNGTANKVHVIQPCPRKGKVLRRRCKFCWEKEQKRKDSPFYCPDCPDQPGLCIIDCFKAFHKY